MLVKFSSDTFSQLTSILTSHDRSFQCGCCLLISLPSLFALIILQLRFRNPCTVICLSLFCFCLLLYCKLGAWFDSHVTSANLNWWIPLHTWASISTTWQQRQILFKMVCKHGVSLNVWSEVDLVTHSQIWVFSFFSQLPQAKWQRAGILLSSDSGFSWTPCILKFHTKLY